MTEILEFDRTYLMAEHLLLMGTLQCIVPPAAIIRNTTCRQVGIGAVFGLLAQSPLNFGMTAYTLAADAIAVLHTTVGVDGCAELFDRPMVVDSYALWIKSAVLGCGLAWSLAASAAGGDWAYY